METETLTTRTKRYHRPKQPEGMQLTTRDLNLLAHVARHRFLSSEHLTALDGGSAQNLRRGLRLLFHHGYLDRPRSQLAEVPATGPRPMVYGLGAKGARALKEHGHLINDGVAWSEKNKRAGSVFIEHTLAIADFMTGVELACRGRGDVGLICDHVIIAKAPAKTRMAREPLRWTVPEKAKGTPFSTIPDGLFGLSFPDNTAAYFLLEIDRGTMPVVRKGLSRTSFARKLAVYWEGWNAGRHVEQFGVAQVRVLTVAPSPERVRNMVAAVRELTDGKGTGFFLFTDQQNLAASDPLSVAWVSGKGEPVKLTG
jgi:hypothetical protein